jgi:hypothetical protein
VHFPNPGSYAITLSDNLERRFSYRLINAMGQIILSENNLASEHLLNATDLADGIYYLVATMPDGATNTQRLVIQH